jgi:uncharacterized delta-60 repeat protein
MENNEGKISSGSDLTSKPGDQDPGFGTNGQIRSGLAKVFTELATGTDQKFYLVRNADDNTLDPHPASISRHLADGRFDPDFNNGESLILPQMMDKEDIGGANIYIQGMVFDQRGAVTCVGHTTASGRDYSHHYPAALRLTSSGTIDADFGDKGRVVYLIGTPSKNAPPVNHFPFASTRRSQQQENGDILFLSQILDYDTQMLSCYLVKTNQNGVPDGQFGENGLLLIGSDAQGPIWTDYGVDGSGNLLVIGRSKAGAQAYGVVTKYTAEGLLDTSYGSGGIQQIEGGEEPPYPIQVHVMADGKITMLVAVSRQYDTPLALMKRLENGAPDTSFNNGEPLVLETVFAARGLRWPELNIDGEGRYLLAGYSGETGWDLRRFTPSGGLDSSFGENGRVGYPDLLSLYSTAVHRHADLLARVSRRGNDTYTYVVRYLGEG